MLFLVMFMYKSGNVVMQKANKSFNANNVIYLSSIAELKLLTKKNFFTLQEYNIVL
jgi:hypothetical protein